MPNEGGRHGRKVRIPLLNESLCLCQQAWQSGIRRKKVLYSPPTEECSLGPRLYPAFCPLQYGKAEED